MDDVTFIVHKIPLYFLVLSEYNPPKISPKGIARRWQIAKMKTCSNFFLGFYLKQWHPWQYLDRGDAMLPTHQNSAILKLSNPGIFHLHEISHKVSDVKLPLRA